jgi:hypothetical protein
VLSSISFSGESNVKNAAQYGQAGKIAELDPASKTAKCFFPDLHQPGRKVKITGTEGTPGHIKKIKFITLHPTKKEQKKVRTGLARLFNVVG